MQLQEQLQEQMQEQLQEQLQEQMQEQLLEQFLEHFLEHFQEQLLEQQETLDNLYLSCLRRAQSQDIDPRDLELAVNTILQLRKQDGIKHEPNQK